MAPLALRRVKYKIITFSLKGVAAVRIEVPKFKKGLRTDASGSNGPKLPPVTAFR
jgi:hypothetical protein